MLFRSSRDPRFCTSCHANLTSLKSDTGVENVASFDSHPEFRVAVRDAVGAVTRVSLDDASRAKDSSQIKLNHKIHLQKDLEGKDGAVTLECSSCHELDAGFKKLKPIQFDKHCRNCHSLGFDERLPGAEVPHGDAEAITVWNLCPGDRKSTRLNSSHTDISRMPSSA